MSVQYDGSRARFVVRWRVDGRQRVRRFSSKPEAARFDADVNQHGRAAQRAAHPGGHEAAVDQVAEIAARRSAREPRDGVCPYATTGGVRWRFVNRQSDGTLSTRRGVLEVGAAPGGGTLLTLRVP